MSSMLPAHSARRRSASARASLAALVFGAVSACTPTVPTTLPPPAITVVSSPVSRATASPEAAAATATTEPIPSPSHTPISQAQAASATGPASTQTAEPVFSVSQPANVRSGPGTNYPVISGLSAGDTATVIGRNAAADWYVIAVPSAPDGQGWIAKVVGDYTGDDSQLPVAPAPPTPIPTRTFTPTRTPPPTLTPTAASRFGITGQLVLCDPKARYAAGVERICFVETIRNPGSSTVTYGVLGVLASNLSSGPSKFQTSWAGTLAIDPGCTGPTDRCGGSWEDGMQIDVPGTYRLFLRICYSTVDICLAGAGEWETLTPGITIEVVS